MINKTWRITQTLWIISAVIFLGACAGGNTQQTTEGEEKGVSTVLPQGKNEVTVIPLKEEVFNHELVSNGKIVASNQADLRFETAEVVACIWVKNGDRVHKGERLAQLDLFRLNQKLAQAKDALERAKLELKDVLIGQGFASTELSRVPAEVMKLAKVKSGYEQSRISYEMAKREEEKATLVAPFDGVVANLFAKPYNMAHTGETFCTIIQTKSMEVDFSVLESELALIKKGDRVAIMPYVDGSSSYQGSIAELNPLVDHNGLVRVKAKVDGQGHLFSGMNVRVRVQRPIKACLVIPKSAVVLRSGKQVVFTLKRGVAQWNYVQVDFENSESCVVRRRLDSHVSEGLAQGDTVIVSGNVNLAHEAPVIVTQIVDHSNKR